jgi:hypothetical protein
LSGQYRKNKRKRHTPELAWRNVEITRVSTNVGLNVVHHTGAEPCFESQPWRELRGMATEPVNGVTDVKISVWLRETLEVGTARPASVGAILGAKPELLFDLSWLPEGFDRVWALALSGRLKFARVARMFIAGSTDSPVRATARTLIDEDHQGGNGKSLSIRVPDGCARRSVDRNGISPLSHTRRSHSSQRSGCGGRQRLHPTHLLLGPLLRHPSMNQ